MRVRDVLRAAGLPGVGRGAPPPGDFCGPPPRRSVRPRERLAVRSGDACTGCGQALVPATRLAASVRVEGAAWWCARCGQQYREAEPGR